MSKNVEYLVIGYSSGDNRYACFHPTLEGARGDLRDLTQGWIYKCRNIEVIESKP